MDIRHHATETIASKVSDLPVALDDHMMAQALAQAAMAAQCNEVPVGAVVVQAGRVIAAAHNAPLGLNDPCGHAEVLALRAAGAALGNYRLTDCDVYITLEPCPMCAGALMQARVRRVVFGARDPKIGAAGSVVNLFAYPALNHHTVVTGGVGADAAARMLQTYFRSKREENRLNAQPLREDALRTPANRFEELPDYPWPEHYISDLPTLNGLRMHHLDLPASGAPLTYLCLHGNPGWSYLYRRMIPIFEASGARVVAPDLIGFGKSDKPKRDDFHSFSWHRQCLFEFVERLNLQRVVLVVQDWGGLLGLTLPMAAPERYCGLLVMNTTLATGDAPLSPGFLGWREMCAKNPEFGVGRLFARGNPHMSAAECAAYDAPFPDRGYRAALRAFPALVPEFSDSDGAAISRAARAFWQNEWQGRSMMAVGMQDPVLGPPVMADLRSQIRGCPPAMELPQAGHFVQEHGAAIAAAAVQWFQPGSAIAATPSTASTQTAAPTL